MTRVGEGPATTTIAQLIGAVPGALDPVMPADPELAAAAAQTVLRAVHISELVDPTAYLDGGELLLTTGMALPASPSGCRAYVRRLTGHGVAALALGLGPVHAAVPPVLVRACERQGLPLLTVPAAEPFQRITRQFWSLVGGAAERELQEALHYQHRLVTAAAAPEPVPEILAQLATAIDGQAVLTDLRGRPLWASHPPGPEDLADLAEAVHRLRHAGPHTAASFPLREHHAVLHPVLCDGDVASYLAVLSDRPSGDARGLVMMTLTLLGLEATHRRAWLTGRHTARAAIAHLVDDGHLAAAPSLAERLGVDAPPARVRVVAARGPAPATLDVVVQALGLGGTDSSRWWGTTTETGVWLMLPARAGEPRPDAVAAALADAGSPACVVLGPVVSLAEVHTTRVMLDTRARSLAPGQAQTWRPHDPVPFVTREWAEETLAPLVRAGEGILTTVTAYVRNRGSWQRTAAELGLHRNSVRAHIARAEHALGADLSDPDHTARIWLALRETAVTPDPVRRPVTERGDAPT